MNTEKRGSEKLMGTCSGMTALSQEELEKVAGAASLPYISGTYSFWKSFPHGKPWPEIFEQVKTEQVRVDGLQDQVANISNGI